MVALLAGSVAGCVGVLRLVSSQGRTKPGSEEKEDIESAGEASRESCGIELLVLGLGWRDAIS